MYMYAHICIHAYVYVYCMCLYMCILCKAFMYACVSLSALATGPTSGTETVWERCRQRYSVG